MKHFASILLILVCQSPTTLAHQSSLRNKASTVTEKIPSSSTTTTPHISARSRRLEDPCIDPREFYYTGDFQISTYYDNSCTEEDMAGVVAYIDQKFHEYTVFNEVLGDLYIHQYGSSCNILYQSDAWQSSDRRLEAQGGTREISSGDPSEGTRILYRRAKLKLGAGGWVYSGNYKCNYCRPEDFDARRNLRIHANNKEVGGRPPTRELPEEEERPEQPANQAHRLTEEAEELQVMVRLVLDDHPTETSYTISEVGGPQVHSKGGFNSPGNGVQEIVRLTKGKRYTFDLYDSAGDGFNGSGRVILFFGGLEFRIPFATIEGNFGVHESIEFTASGEANAAATVHSEEDLFPELELDMSKHIYYHLRTKFHSDPNHCMYHKNPSIWVDLTKSTKTEADNTCTSIVPVPAVTPSPNAPNPVTTTPPPSPSPSPPAASTDWTTWTVNQDKRCGSSEADARGNCRPTCSNAEDCPSGQWCFGVLKNYCGSKPQPPDYGSCRPRGGYGCGVTELHARETCGNDCRHMVHCASGESCHPLQLNFCQC